MGSEAMNFLRRPFGDQVFGLGFGPFDRRPGELFTSRTWFEGHYRTGHWPTPHEAIAPWLMPIRGWSPKP